MQVSCLGPTAERHLPLPGRTSIDGLPEAQPCAPTMTDRTGRGTKSTSTTERDR